MVDPGANFREAVAQCGYSIDLPSGVQHMGSQTSMILARDEAYSI